MHAHLTQLCIPLQYESARERVASGRIFKWDERPLIALPWLIVSELLLTNFRRNGGETADTKVPTADMARYRHVLVDARRAIVSQQAQAAVRRTDPEGDELQEEQQEDGEQEDENNGYPRRAFTSFATFKKSREVAEMAQEDASEVDSGNMTMTDSANTSRTDSTVSASMEEQPETAILSREQTERPIVAPIIADFEVLDLDG